MVIYSVNGFVLGIILSKYIYFFISCQYLNIENILIFYMLKSKQCWNLEKCKPINQHIEHFYILFGYILERVDYHK